MPGDRDENRRWLVECKRTDKKSISLSSAWWDRISGEARGHNRRPVIEIELGKHHLYVIDEQDWLEFDQLLEDGQDG